MELSGTAELGERARLDPEASPDSDRELRDARAMILERRLPLAERVEQDLVRAIALALERCFWA